MIVLVNSRVSRQLCSNSARNQIDNGSKPTSIDASGAGTHASERAAEMATLNAKLRTPQLSGSTCQTCRTWEQLLPGHYRACHKTATLRSFSVQKTAPMQGFWEFERHGKTGKRAWNSAAGKTGKRRENGKTDFEISFAFTPVRACEIGGQSSHLQPSPALAISRHL